MPIYNDSLADYIQHMYAEEDPALRQIRRGIETHGLPPITVKADEGRFLQFLVCVSGARRALEIGTLGGYSGTWIARGLAPGGRLITLEQDPERATLARAHFELAGLSRQVEVRVGDAHSLLPGLESLSPFDFVFIDAEKEGYPAYLDWTVNHLRPGGVLAAHNAFRGGAIVEGSGDESTLAIQAFNARLARLPAFISTIYPAGDGMAIAVRQRPGQPPSGR
jgi:predicted O-methyltransferase YrrM